MHDHLATAPTPTAQLNTPVLFLVFNRPDVTAQVFQAIREAKPTRLYVAADGPRINRPGEEEKCAETRRIATNVDWPCEVKTLFRTENLGCKVAVSGAISWFFNNEAEGIILEDDCLPSKSFFTFCEELLGKYRDDQRIWQISGSTFYPEAITPNEADYFFSRYGSIWGWASWRRAWQHYDPDMTLWPEISKPTNMKNIFPYNGELIAKKKIGQQLYKNTIDTWDYQWGFCKNYNNGLSIVPNLNQIKNIGFGPNATHTFNTNSDAPTLLHLISDKIKHPFFVVTDKNYELRYSKNSFKNNNLAIRITKRILQWIRKA